MPPSNVDPFILHSIRLTDYQFELYTSRLYMDAPVSFFCRYHTLNMHKPGKLPLSSTFESHHATPCMTLPCPAVPPHSLENEHSIQRSSFHWGRTPCQKHCKTSSQDLPNISRYSKIFQASWAPSESSELGICSEMLTSSAGPPVGKKPSFSTQLRGLHQQFVLILCQARGMAAIVEGRDETLTLWIIWIHRSIEETPTFSWVFSKHIWDDVQILSNNYGKHDMQISRLGSVIYGVILVSTTSLHLCN